MFTKILIANRGEIACRIQRTARRLGIGTVAVFSDADAGARHVREADAAVRIGPAPAGESYLAIERILDAARRSGAEAIHPGYGFLSENAGFAEACAAAGLVFIGPPAAAIRAMGSKRAARALMHAAGVPLVPGYHGAAQDEPALRAAAEEIGWPLLIKASAGGGGKGMRIVRRAGEFADALAACRREAQAAFGDAQVLLEKYLAPARHIEVQVFADRHGHCLHLHERDCSVQRRYQKVVEEAPAPGLTAARRAAMGAAAVAAARAVDYVGAGTVEFIVGADGAFHFMEMNTRLQVEHPVTEMITGLDLVEWQLRVAAGEALPLAQEDVPLIGHAFEARLYAEDPARGFLPAPGRLLHFALPAENAAVRVDSGVEAGDAIPADYDPMIAKLIVRGADRADALRRMRAALAEVHLVGVASNVDFLARLFANAAFAAADLDTGLIERERADLLAAGEAAPDEIFQIAALAEWQAEREFAQARAAASADPHSPWWASDGFRLNGAQARTLGFRQGERLVNLQLRQDGERIALQHEGRTVSASVWRSGENRLVIELDGRRFRATVVAVGAQRHVLAEARHWIVQREDPLRIDEREETGAGGLTAPMPGKVLALLVEPGCAVERGAPLLILEAMKMEHTLSAPADGRVQGFHCAPGDSVAEGTQLVAFEPNASSNVGPKGSG